ncbi:ATP-dependent RNA helicase [Thioclava sp. L04-15]|uniref:DEAD/DEAH box helicase n=1 Tax=Thioclava sp. L04-15 TaxID=1915318 RepID=UPI000998BF3A|nr:DEAD/DEAH box helicase [Thioclava sp. L04-15]OOY27190.1 ATP-dependent RNA helicase [Thioclava sp. L04-15]TNE89502.1 MAG: DEAD/DEAH box helicase [Paracoccaceae bacterium]
MISPLSEALAERGYDTLTPVQEAVIAPELAGSDLLVSAQTGSGKTVGFGLAIAPTLLGEAEKFGPPAVPLALVVAPTRELAFQVMRELSWLYAKTGAVVASCVGGMDIRQERRALDRGAHVVVGTPGRLRDHIERGSLDLGDVRAVVLDEADEMLDLGFREDLEFILGAAPEERRTLLFSATVSPMIARLAEQFQRDAQRINTIGAAEQHADISYQALRVAASDSEHAIFNLLRYHADESAIVFANTRAAVTHLTTRLGNRGLATVSLSGELSQAERSHALQAMRDGRARVCVATDVAARGIDLPKLSLVIHADLPTNTETLLHRSGRTGRAGRKGISALIVPPKMVKRAERLLKWAKIDAEWGVAPSADEILRRDEERLMSDPSWETPLTEEEAAFAARLLAQRSPEVVAAAFLRLHQSRHAAPEDLLPPETKLAREERDFGPSRWFALSVGRDDRAEPRWLLPVLRRAADLERNAIGAIRIQQSETFVEIAESSAEQFLGALDSEGALTEEISVRPLDGPPNFQRGRSPRPEGGKPRFEGKKPRPDRPARKFDDAPKPERKPQPAPERPKAWEPREEGGKPSKFAKAAPKAEGKRKAKWAPETEALDLPEFDGEPARKPAPSGKGAKYAPRKPAGGKGGKPFKKGKPGAAGDGKPFKGGAKPSRKPRASGNDAPRRPKR